MLVWIQWIGLWPVSFKVSGRKHISVVRRGKDWILGKGLGEAVENEEEVFAEKLDDECITLVELVGTKNIQTRVGGGVLSVIRMDVQSVGSGGNDVFKIRVDEGGVFAVGMDGESMEVQEGDEMKARVEKELFLPSGWMGRCMWRMWSRPGLRKELFVSLGRLCIAGLSWDLF